jgi:hypothetical protein
LSHRLFRAELLELAFELLLFFPDGPQGRVERGAEHPEELLLHFEGE